MHGILFIIGLLLILTGLFIPLNPVPGLQISPNIGLPILGGILMVPSLAMMKKR